MAEKKNVSLPQEVIDQIRAELLKELRAEFHKEEQAPPVRDEAAEAWLEERVPVTLFYDGGKYKDPVFVAVNGENCVIKRGEPVMVKRKFVLVLEQSAQQDKEAADLAQAMQRSYETETRKLFY